jgi:apolipoprotein N-acyltransferase
MHDLPALAHRARLLGALVAWGMLAAASPGVLTRDGLPVLAVLGVAVWGYAEARPCAGKEWKGFLAHVLGAAPGGAATMLWIRFVYPPPLLYVGLGMGCYSALGGVLLRRILAAFPGRAGGPPLAPLAPLAIGLAWTAQDVLRAVVPMPFGAEWLRFGHYAHAWLPLAASARVWGVSGLGFALASLAGCLAWARHVRFLDVGRRMGALVPGLSSGMAPALLGLAFGAATSAPATVPGPRVLVVQPGFEQRRKQYGEPIENFAALGRLTRDALAAERAAGRPEPDLVAWGESMLYVPLFEVEVRALAAETGPGYEARSVPIRADLEWMSRMEDREVRGKLFGLGPSARPGAVPILPAGTSFLAGAEVFVAHDGEIRRTNAAVLYDAAARRSRSAGKRFLVPGAETMYGLVRVPAIRAFIEEVSGYVPDLLAAGETGVLPLVARDGRRYAIATTVCFDNSHLAAYTDPVAAGEVDLHLVVSNEAWYKRSFEAEQMVAFTRVAALASGRAIVRATNSGISLAMGADGRELARITAAGPGGRDKMVAGHLAVDVPVPAPGARSAPPIARLRAPLDAAWLALALALALLGIARGRRAAASFGAGGNPGDRPG